MSSHKSEMWGKLPFFTDDEYLCDYIFMYVIWVGSDFMSELGTTWQTLETCIKIWLKILPPACFSHQVCEGPTTICFFFSFLHLQPPTRCPQSASIYSSRPLIREKRQQKRQFSKEGKRDGGCVVWSAWKFTCHWFPLCPSPPHAAVCCLKDWKRKHRPAGPSSNPSVSSGEGPEAERHLNRDAALFRTPAGGSTIQ